MQTPLIARPFYPAVSFYEENPYQPVKPIIDTDILITYAKSTQFVGEFLEKLPRRKNHENNPPPQG
ncbi:hypothetical protein HFM15_002351 [Vibrio cholerae]|uniref:hypothetical protein n=1 Tax=Vibrio cholerae TaxID=666 RepID=UPI003F583225|nr:hypothetical protein [Vibrio cholerae]